MRGYPGLMLAAIASLATPITAAMAAVDHTATISPSEFRRRRLPIGQAQGSRRLRSRWKAEGPKRRPNRMRISKRVRRKHRRAA